MTDTIPDTILEVTPEPWYGRTAFISIVGLGLLVGVLIYTVADSEAENQRLLRRITDLEWERDVYGKRVAVLESEAVVPKQEENADAPDETLSPLREE